jgi:hypothetical protein
MVCGNGVWKACDAALLDAPAADPAPGPRYNRIGPATASTLDAPPSSIICSEGELFWLVSSPDLAGANRSAN